MMSSTFRLGRSNGLVAVSCMLLCSFAPALFAADAELESLEREYQALEATEAKRVAEEKARPRAEAEVEARPRASHVLTDAGGGMLLQPSSGLQWTQSDNGSDINWEAASAYCAAKGGGWRLPTTAELQSLVGGEGRPCGDFTCNVSPLFRLTSWYFWSNETNGSSEAWLVTLNWGPRNSTLRSYSFLRALCVRPY